MLWKNIFYGPVFSRRLGHSLGINLLPVNRKICNFNCIYCECGLNEKSAPKTALPSFSEFEQAITDTLFDLKQKGQVIDSITFSGNGEPTLHPEFNKIIMTTIEKRNTFYPNSKITVLTNSTNLNKENIRNALKLIDLPICKLDAGTEEMYQKIDQPETSMTLDEITERLIEFNGNLFIQTIFLRGKIDDINIDNTTQPELDEWIKRLKKIRPKLIMIYSLDRTPPYSTLQKINLEEMGKIAKLVRDCNIKAECYF